MYEELKELSEEIRAYGLAIGELSNEAVESAKDGRYMAALACLFILTEQVLKQANGKVSGNFNTQIFEMIKSNMISKKEGDVLTDLRNIRNLLFHENQYMCAIIDKNGKAAMFSENDTKKQLWNKLSLPIFLICRRLVAS